jgi:uncharacterized membrane protein YjdF
MFTRSRLVLYAITLAYIIAGVINALKEESGEFVVYAVVLVVVVSIGYYVLYRLQLPLYLSWLLALLGALHLAGGTVFVNGAVLYDYVLIPIPNWTGLTIWKFDQLVHPYGAFIAALFTFAALRRWTALGAVMIIPIAFMFANGAGALNEVVEFGTKMLIPGTNVGGYYNTALDLVFNMLGAALGSVAGYFIITRRLADPTISR